ncbi:MAG: hypothetical protein ISR72_05905 [Methylobacter sp.]|nr:hypothetical protein [Methylobacter sp.]
MNVFKQIFTMSYSRIIFSSLIIIISTLLSLFIFDVLKGPKWSSIIPGLLTGFVIALFQAFLSWFELKKIDEYDALKIKKILFDRKNPVYYGDLISKAETEINIQGVTAQRFLEDFANENTIVSKEKKVLIQALKNDVNVKILIADNNWLINNDDKRKAEMAEPRLNELELEYSNFHYNRYKQLPTHSIVIIDNDCIVGPVFPNVSSKDTPAIHLKRDSKFAEHYIEYFNKEWDKWGKDKELED